MAKDDKKVKRGVYLYIDGKGITNDIKSISNEIKGLQRDIQNMTIGSEEYNRTMAKIKHLQGILKEHRQEIRGVTRETKRSTLSLGKLADGFNRFGGIIVSVIGFLTGFALALRSIREECNKLEESQAGLKALTGLDDESITWLTAQAKTLSTTMTKEGLRVRQSAAEILDAFMLVGSAKPELLGNKEALRQVTEEAMRLQAAAKDITLNEAVDSLTLSLNQYGAAADQAGKFSNVLAAGSKAGSANIASQAKAIRISGTAAAAANISIEQTVGLIETLAYKGIKDEVAGTGLKRFFLKLQTGADETNPKIVGLDKALENLKNKNMDAGAIKKMFGEEGFNAASVILQNTEMVNDFTKAVTGTNIAYEQSTINSATAAAKLDQARNSMKLAAIELGEKLNPAFTVSTNMMTNIVKFLPGLIDWFQKWGGTIVALLGPIAIYVTYLKLAALYHTRLNVITKIAATLKVLYAAATANLAGNLTGSNKILTLFSANIIKNNIILKMATVATYLYAAAKARLAGNIVTSTLAMKASREAFIALKAAMTANVYLGIAAVVIGLAAAIYKLATRTSEAKTAIEEFYSAVRQERNELNKVYNQLLKTNEKTDERTRLINEFNSQFGKYLTNLLSEKSTVDDIKKAYREATVAMNDHYARELLASKQAEIVKESLDEQSKSLKESVDMAVNATKEQKARLAELVSDVTNQTITDDPQYGEGDVRRKIYQQINQEFGSGAAYDLFGDSQGWEKFTQKINPFIDGVDKTIKKTNELKAELAPFIKSLSTPLSVYTNGNGNEKCPVCGNSPCTCNTVNDDKKDQDKFAKVEEDYYQRISDIKKKYLADDQMTQEEYNQQMQQAEMQLLQDKLKVKGLEPSEIQHLNDLILNAEIKARDELRKLDEQSVKDTEKMQKEQSEKAFSRLDKEYQMQIEEATMYHYQNKTSEEEYLNELRQLQKNYYDKVLNDTAVSEEDKQKILRQNSDAQLEDAKKKYEAEVEAFTNMKDNMMNVSKQLGESMAEFFTNEEQDFGDFMKNVLVILLDTLEKQLIATQAAAIAEVTIKDISTKGLLGLAAAAGKIALITAAFETAKGLLGNFYTGGYTGSGEWDQPQGIVHSNEFVANRYAVANPAVRPVLDLIDNAQRTGSIGNLTAQDIASVVGSGLTTQASQAAQVVQIGSAQSNPEMTRTINELNSVIEKLIGRLNDPFYTLNVISGRSGLKNKLDEYETLLNNKSRKS